MKENKPQIYLILQMLCLIYAQDLIGLGKWIFIAFSIILYVLVIVEVFKKYFGNQR